jgi:hypothetical protein
MSETTGAEFLSSSRPQAAGLDWTHEKSNEAWQKRELVREAVRGYWSEVCCVEEVMKTGALSTVDGIHIHTRHPNRA